MSKAFVLVIILLLAQGIVSQGNTPNKKEELDLAYINNEIKEFHNEILKLVPFYKNKIRDNKLGVPLGLGHHNFFSDSEKYVYRSDAYFYFSGGNVQKLKHIYEQTDVGSLITEIRIVELNNVAAEPPYDIKITYLSWGNEEEDRRYQGSEKDTLKAADLVRSSDEIKIPLGAQKEEFTMEDNLGQNPYEKYKILLSYRDTLKQVKRTLEYHIQGKELIRKNKILRSLELGKNN